MGLRQHIDAAGRAQRHDSAGVYSRAKNPLLFWFFYSCLAPHPVLRTTLSPEGRGNDVASLRNNASYRATIFPRRKTNCLPSAMLHRFGKCYKTGFQSRQNPCCCQQNRIVLVEGSELFHVEERRADPATQQCCRPATDGLTIPPFPPELT